MHLKWGNHLSAGHSVTRLFHRFISLGKVPRPVSLENQVTIWVARSRGLPRSTLVVSNQPRLCGTLEVTQS